MITPDDVKYLQNRLSKKAYFGLIVMFVVGFLLFISAIMNIYMATKFASIVGKSLFDIAQGWVQGISINSTYSGIYIMALQRFEMGLTQTAMAIIFIVSFPYCLKARKRYERILKTMVGT